MSLTALAIRICTVRAIRAAVWPEFVVADSPQEPLDLLKKGRPLVAVYTGHTTNRFEAVELMSGDPKVSLAIQVFLPPELTLAPIAGGPPQTFDTRLEGAETVLDMVERRIVSALVGQFEPWSALWARFLTAVPRLDSASYLIEIGGSGVRTSAREITFDLDPLWEQVPGAAPQAHWADLVALMRADTGDEGYAAFADWLAAEILGPQPLAQDERDRMALGLDARAATQIGILPIVRGSEVDLAEVDVDADGDVPLAITAADP